MSAVAIRVPVEHLRAAVKLLAGATIVAAVVVHLGSGAVLDGLRAVSPTAVVAALGLGAVTTAASAARWCVVARGLGLPLRFGAAVADCYRAQFLNSVLPAGVLGDVHRAVDHGRRSGDLGRGVRAVVLERVAGQVVVVVVSLAVLLALPGPLRPLLVGLGGAGPALAGAAAVTTAVLLGLAGILRVRRARLLAVGRQAPVINRPSCGSAAPSETREGLVILGPERHEHVGRCARALTGLLDGVRHGLGTARTGPAVLGLSVVAMAGHLALLAVAAAAVGVHASPATLTPLLLLSLLAMGLPLNIGGWGPREATTAVAFGASGLGADAGLATAVAFGVLALVSTLPGLGVLLLRR